MYIASHSRTGEWGIEKNLEGNGHELIEILSRRVSTTEENHEELRITGIPVETPNYLIHDAIS
jgi:hypothetical protein